MDTRPSPLSREELTRVIEGRGHAGRVPMMVRFWTDPKVFGENEAQARMLLDSAPEDVQPIWFRMPDVYTAPEDAPGYRWCWHDRLEDAKALDNAGFIRDPEEDLAPFFRDFPSAEYPGLTLNAAKPDGRYRLGCWWYFYFERFWSLRGMQSALTDLYLYPDKVHALFRRLTDFYLRAVERGRREMQLDGIFTSDDLGTQTSTFFSLEIFDEFFAPYYREIIDRVHELGMHFWLHACGNIQALIPRLIELGVDVLHPIQKYTMDERVIARTFGDRLTIWSGFDVQRIMPYGTPEDVRREVQYLIRTYKRPEGRFMLTLGNGATPDIPIGNLKALLEESVKLGVYR